MTTKINEKMTKTKENRQQEENGANPLPATLAVLALAALALIAFSTQANAKLEQTALIEFAFSQDAAGETKLALTDFKTGLAELPNYVEPSNREFEVRLLTQQGTAVHSIWLNDPRYVYYDFIGENGTLSGGRTFNANARFFAVVPVSGEARYAAVFDAKGNKLIAVDLFTGKTVEENAWTEKAFEPEEMQATQWGLIETLVLLAAAALLALVILGLVVFRKTSGRKRV